MDNNKLQELILQQLTTLAEGQRQIEARIEIVKDLQSRMGNVEARLGGLETGQRRIEMRMENEVIEKIRAVFDGWKAHEEKLERVMSTLQEHETKLEHVINVVDDISTDTRYLVARVAKLEKLAKQP